VTFQRAMKLALSHSVEIAIADAEVRRASAAYMETRAAYIPQLIVGSSVGYAYGFPLSPRRCRAYAVQCHNAIVGLEPCVNGVCSFVIFQELSTT
jgi:Outer membrane efflux protein